MPQKIDFKHIASAVDIETVAHSLGIRFDKHNRATCPVCESERCLELKPETNTFIDYSAEPRPGCEYLTGDCIALYAHIKQTGMYPAAKAIHDQFLGGATAPVETAPQKPESRTVAKAAQPAPTFDPEKFAAKLVYSQEVAALGIGEEDAARIGLGFHPQRHRVFCGLRNPDGSWSGFIAIDNAAAIKMPPNWIPSSVVPFKKRA